MNEAQDNKKLILGIGLIGLGLLDFLRKLDLVSFSPLDVLVALLFTALGLSFGSLFKRDKRWRQLVVAGLFFSLAAVVSLDLMKFSVLQAPIFLVGLASTFASIFILTHRQQWWAIIPSGILFTLALLAAAEALPFIQLANRGAIFLLGVALTFTFLYLLPNESGRQRWAKHPALATGGLGSIVLISSLGLLP